MKRTRFIAIALAVLIAVAFVSCDGDNATPPQKECEHDFDYETIAEPTCSAEGEFVITCKKCGFSESRKIPPISHKFNYQVKGDGHLGTCTECGHTTGVEGHTYGYCSISADEHHQVCTKCESELAGSNGDHVYVDYRCKDCSAWGKGPTGGYVFYDCDADNDSGNRDGLISTECGWRFLEAAPADLRVIKGVPTVDSNADGYDDKATKKFIFGYYWESFTSSDSSVVGTSKDIGTGKKNTEKLVEVMGTMHTFGIQKPTSGAAPILDYAARLCEILEYTDADGQPYDDWFLPSFDELKLVSSELPGTLDFSGYNAYYSSSERGNDEAYCYCPGANSSAFRYKQASIRPIRAFQPET